MRPVAIGVASVVGLLLLIVGGMLWFRRSGRLLKSEPDVRLSSPYGAGVSRSVNYLEGREEKRHTNFYWSGFSRTANAFERISSTEEILLLTDTMVYMYQKSGRLAVIMMMAPKGSQHALIIRKICTTRTLSINNTSFIVNRHTHFQCVCLGREIRQ